MATSPGSEFQLFYSPYFAFRNRKFYEAFLANDKPIPISHEFFMDIYHVVSNPHQASYQAIKALNIDLEITILEYYLNLREHTHSVVCM